MSWIKEFSWFCVFVLVVGIFGLVWWFFPELIVWRFPELAHMEPTQKSAFSDMYGILSAFFSGIALVGVIFAVFMQRKELQLQREELVLTRKEMRRSAKAQEESSQSLSKQLEEMKEQTELHMRPLIIVKYGTLIQKGQHTFFAINVGNSTAINMKIYSIEENNYIVCNSSTLAKSETEHCTLDHRKDNELIITFQNINKEDYYVKETIIQKRHEVTEFEKGKCDLLTTLPS